MCAVCVRSAFLACEGYFTRGIWRALNYLSADHRLHDLVKAVKRLGYWALLSPLLQIINAG